MTTRTPSQRSAMSRAKGAKFERRLAVAFRPYFPDARRSRDNGFRSSNGSSPDTGDVDLGTGEFFVSAKDNHEGDTDSACTVGKWFTECQDKAGALGRAGLLIQKRPNYADPLDSWCWLTLTDLIEMTTGGYALAPAALDVPVRMSLRDVLGQLAANGLTPVVPETGPQIDAERPDPLAGGALPVTATGPPGAELA